MLLALRPGKFADSLCKKPLVAWMSCANEPRATSRWKKCTDSGMKSDKPDKHQPLSKGSRYERYTPLTVNHTTTLEEAFNLEVPIRLPLTKLPRPRLDVTKYCRYHRGIGHNTKDCWALKDKLKELIQAGYLA